MYFSPTPLEPDFLRLAAEHPYIYNAIKAGAVFALGLLAKKPLENWWAERGELKKNRKAMYLALAEMYTEVQFLYGGIEQVLSHNDACSQTREVTRIVEKFYERIKPRNYDQELKTLRAARGSLVDEVEAFEQVMSYLALLPPLQAPVQDKLTAAMAFSEKLARAPLVENFDLEKFSLAVAERSNAGHLRQKKGVLADIGEATTAQENAAAQIGEFQEKQRKDLEGLEKQESELNLDEARKVLGKFQELKAKAEKKSVA
jgi:hypothetical protein